MKTDYETHASTFLSKHLIGAVSLCFGIILTLFVFQLWVGFAGAILLLAASAAAGILVAHYRANVAPCDLTDWQIARLPEGTITPFNIDLIEPDSYDVTLGDEFLQIQPDGTTKVVKADELVVQPGECWLAHTQETFRFPHNIKGILQGKSSWARLSLFVECAGLFDKGFEGTAVLELYNAGTWGVKIRKGDRIAQMSFHRTLAACAPYGDSRRNSHYQEQQGAHASWLSKHERVVPAEPTPE